MAQAYVYVRFSTKQQDKGTSADRQLELCQSFCTRRGWEIVDVIQDLGRSAWKGHHLSSGALGEFADKVRAGEIAPGTILVVEQLDRLSRLEPRTTQRWMEDLCSLGLRIATVQGEKIFDDDSLRGGSGLIDVLEILIKSQVAHGESKRKSDIMRDAWKRKQDDTRKNVVMTTQCPAWLEVTRDRKFRVIPERGELVREIYQMAADGLGTRAIAMRLNARKVPTWGKWRAKTSAAGWTYSYINRILEAPQAEGEYHARTVRKPGERETVESYYPRIVDADLVARARAAKKARVRTGGRTRLSWHNLFMGMVYCAGCGGRMTLNRPAANGTNSALTKRGYFVCQNASLRRACDRKDFFRYGPFEDAALEAILHMALEDKHFKRADQSGRLAVELATIDKAVVNKKEEVQRLVRLLSRQDIPEVEIELEGASQELRKLEGERDEVAAQLAAARGSVSPAEHLQRVMEIRAAIHAPDEETRLAARAKVHEAIKAVVHGVLCNTADTTFGEPRKTITLFKPLGNIIFDTEGNRLDDGRHNTETLEEILGLSPAEIADFKRRNLDFADAFIEAFERFEAQVAEQERDDENA